MGDTRNEPPGKPGINPTWSSSAKDMVSTALGASRLWATFGYGIVNEVYWPSTGQPQIRDLGFIIAGPDGWTEVKRAQRYSISMPKPYVPLPRVVHRGDNYRLELEYLVHPLRDALLIRYKLDGDDLKLYSLISPHLNGERHDNTAWAGEDLSAQLGYAALCLRNDSGFSRASAGYVGFSDGWQDFDKNGKMTWTYPEAGEGNVALMGELAANSGTLALCFAETVEGARTLARSSLADDYDDVVRIFTGQWEDWGRTLDIPHASPEIKHEAQLSAAVIKIHEDRTYAGAMVASLSVPWGSSHDDLGGYHLVWTRDAVEAAFAMIAVGQLTDAARTLAYLVGTQAEDGSWAQNYFPDGQGYWEGKQLDEVALPVLLMAKLRAVGHLTIARPIETMVEKAVGFMVRNGPMTDQDRWEENSGASPFTLTATICALVAAADLMAPEERDYVLSLADCWNERIEDWTYTTGGPLCAPHGVDGYYVRIAPRSDQKGLRGVVEIRNVGGEETAAADLVGLEFLTLVRSGLRAADDPGILNTVKIIDAVLRRETPSGPSYHRYNGDGYGEHADGSPYDGKGIGRLWPLLTGERGHFAISADGDARPYLDAMSRMTGPGGLLPEQIWDSDPIPERGLWPGKPSGSAMPLIWAHAEFLKLLAAQADGRPSEALAVVEQRYGGKRPTAAQWHWRENSPFDALPAGRALLIERGAPFILRYRLADGAQPREKPSAPTQLGMHGVLFAPADLPAGATLSFSFADDASEGGDLTIALG
ncbi:glucan 1,4-alpha-glucosidase [Youhaiella tibetensis]|uniref:Glucan 1,4-alpha-glucosidase n=1 Tax=Paradevosia tibetensis TaxID=1447062 RepID=A0A5B9DKP7_9HYPH|nr:glycoside hydrolase family 15 protein [Youhaiella tibetensis]QEE19442.1 glucan 1,4-alpha-glucosidase [Youhaiella tibetensis]GGF33119.1 glucan 1,4-alpha-glucosidase [Youhaiella tibetensis]